MFYCSKRYKDIWKLILQNGCEIEINMSCEFNNFNAKFQLPEGKKVARPLRLGAPSVTELPCAIVLTPLNRNFVNIYESLYVFIKELGNFVLY